MEIHPIAFFESPLKSKFGIPRQSGLVSGLTGRIVFEPEYRKMEAVRGLEDFSHLWIIWEFSQNTPEQHPTLGPVIHVLGADLMDGTPIYDVKPYVAYADAHPEARSGFVDQTVWEPLKVMIPEALAAKIPSDYLGALKATLEQDPRPRYHDDPERVYGMPFLNFDVRFKVQGKVLTVVDCVTS